jgi:hypothetical protein
MRILSLDLARLTGWSVGSPAGVEGFGTHEFAKTDSWELGEYGMSARIGFRTMLAHTEPELVVYESPILRSGTIQTRGNGKQFVATVDTPQKLRKMYGLPFELEIECYRRSIKVREANIGQVRRAFLAPHKVPRDSKSAKSAIKVIARRRGWDVLDDNEADSLAVLEYELGLRCPREMTARKINAGPSARMSSLGANVFVGSRVFFPPAIAKAEAARTESPGDGPSNASRTATAGPSGTLAIIRPSQPDMISTSSGRQLTPLYRR